MTVRSSTVSSVSGGKVGRGTQRLVGANPEHRVLVLSLNGGGVREGAQLSKRVLECAAEFVVRSFLDGIAERVR